MTSFSRQNYEEPSIMMPNHNSFDISMSMISKKKKSVQHPKVRILFTIYVSIYRFELKIYINPKLHIPIKPIF